MRRRKGEPGRHTNRAIGAPIKRGAPGLTRNKRTLLVVIWASLPKRSFGCLLFTFRCEKRQTSLVRRRLEDVTPVDSRDVLEALGC